MRRVNGRYRFILALLAISMFGSGSVLSAGEGFIVSPLPVRNMYPPLIRFFDPVPDSALREYSNWDVRLDQHISNTILADQWLANQLLVDMELYVADHTVRKVLTRDMDLSVRLSLQRPFNGVLDPLVNNVHDLLSVPAMGRTFRPDNSFAYYFRPGNGTGWQGRGRWEVGSGKWEVGSGKWEVGSGKWEVGSGKWEVGSGKWEIP